MKYSIVLFFFLCITKAVAQTDSTMAGKPGQICYVKGQKFLINGTSEKLQKLPHYLQKNSEAMAEWKLHRSFSNKSTPFALTLLGSIVAGAVTVGKNNKLAMGFGAAAALSGYLGTRLYNKGIPHLHRSICIYNSTIP